MQLMLLLLLGPVLLLLAFHELPAAGETLLTRAKIRHEELKRAARTVVGQEAGACRRRRAQINV